MPLVPLSRSLFAIVDECDFEVVSAHRWYARPIERRSGGYYAVRSSGRRTIYLHRTILNAPDGLVVDHVDGNGLDNRRSNIRLCSRSLNSVNRRSYTPASGFRGVYLHPIKKVWQAKLDFKGVVHRLGEFKCPKVAARHYDDAARRLFGEFAVLNFPKDA